MMLQQSVTAVALHMHLMPLNDAVGAAPQSTAATSTTASLCAHHSIPCWVWDSIKPLDRPLLESLFLVVVLLYAQ
jgi:hypothetical protein